MQTRASPRAWHWLRRLAMSAKGQDGDAHHDDGVGEASSHRTGDAMMAAVRTTITLDSDVHSLLKKRMRERGTTFKETLNSALREGLGEQKPGKRFRQRTFRLGPPLVELDKATQLAGELEDLGLIEKMRREA